jgi:hypothetical protein
VTNDIEQVISLKKLFEETKSYLPLMLDCSALKGV